MLLRCWPLLFICAASTGWAHVDGEALLAQAARPRMEEIRTLVAAAKTDPVAQQFLLKLAPHRDPKLAETLVAHVPSIIAAFEWSYPGATYLALGRDAAFLGDVLDGFYLGLEQRRVQRIDASRQTVTDVRSEDLINFLRDTTGFDINRLAQSSGWVIFDQTFWNESSQTRILAREILRACLTRPGLCTPELFAEKFGVLNTGALRQDVEMYRQNVVGGSGPSDVGDSAALRNFFFEERAYVKTANEPAGVLSVAVDPALIYTEVYHDTFSKLVAGEKTLAAPGTPSGLEERLRILASMVQILETVDSEKFRAAVEKAAGELRYKFPRARVTGAAGVAAIRGFKFGDFDAKGKSRARMRVLLNAAAVQKRNATTIDAAIQVIKGVLEKTKSNMFQVTVDDFLQMLAPGVDNPVDDYLSKIASVWQSNIERFFATNPTIADIGRAQLQSRNLDVMRALIRGYQPRIRTAADFIELMKPVYGPGVYEPYTAALEALWLDRRTIPAFFQLQPSIEDVEAAKIQASSIEVNIRLNREYQTQVPDAATFLRLMKPSVESPSEAYLGALGKLWLEKGTIKNFVKTKPGPEEVTQAKRMSNRIDTILALTRALIPQTRTAAEMIQIMAPSVSTPHESYKQEIDNEVQKPDNLKRFIALKPTIDEARDLEAITSSIQASLAVIRASLPLVRSAGDFIKLLTPKGGVSGDFEIRLNQFCAEDETLKKFASLRPSDAEIDEFATHASLDEAALERLRSKRAALIPEVTPPASTPADKRSFLKKCFGALRKREG